MTKNIFPNKNYNVK